ncbi:MAG: hypothetical protein K1000chlam2_00031 [Chlamydiae bacterium]|nr:hypothetical protein [Chlamydiota bacterium]
MSDDMDYLDDERDVADAKAAVKEVKRLGAKPLKQLAKELLIKLDKGRSIKEWQDAEKVSPEDGDRVVMKIEVSCEGWFLPNSPPGDWMIDKKANEKIIGMTWRLHESQEKYKESEEEEKND